MKSHRQDQSSTALRCAAHCVLAFTIVLALVGATPSAQAQTYTVLYTFTGGADGANPTSSLVRDAAGNLYGTTFAGGGSGTGCAEDTGCGTVFELTKAGHLKVLYTFTGGNDGSNPTTGLVRDHAGNLYGTADTAGQYAGGVAYMVPKTGGQSVLHAFKGGPDDVSPHISALTRDSAGNLYGTGEVGGANGVGAVFEISSGTEKLLYSFLHSSSDGGAPWGGVIRDSAGNLYGSTVFGGANGVGTVFKLTSSGTESWLYSFPGNPGEQIPFAGVIRDSKGNLYGTTYNGGAFGSNGTVYELNKSGTQTTFLFSFNQFDGGEPYAGVVRDKAGNLYGTTTLGGANAYGAVFKIDSSGNETVLHSFTGTDGETPYGGLVIDSAGNLYGTARDGGGSKVCANGGCGVIFKITP
jgi:uncharacterized repeat protein (TIGR03803 family)